MKVQPIFRARTTAAAILAMLLASASPALGQTVLTTITPNPVNICSDIIRLTVDIDDPAGGPATTTFQQVLPVGCSITIVPGGASCHPNLADFTPWPTAPNIIDYRILDGQKCTFTFDLFIPCSVTPTITPAGAFLQITYPPLTGLVALDRTFQVIVPVLQLDNFKDVSGTLITPTTATLPEKLLVSSGRTRQFDIVLTEGVLNEFVFEYDFESEIKPTQLKFENCAGSGSSIVLTFPSGLPPSSSPYPVPFRSAEFTTLFGSGRSKMRFGDCIRVTETFDVVQCSPTPDNDGTKYSVTMSCPNPPAVCPPETVSRFILVETSTGGITPSIAFSSPLAFCPGMPPAPSDIIVSFKNSKHDESVTDHPEDDKLPGSAMKTLHTIAFSMNQDVFSSMGQIKLEAAGGTPSVDVSSLPGFYTCLGAPTYRVILDFDVLKTQPLGLFGPLTNGFIPETPMALYNELVDEGMISIRFCGMEFDCKKAKFYGGVEFDDWPKPGSGFMFFGKDGNDSFEFLYDDMCQQDHGPHLPITYDFGNLHNKFPVTALAEATVPARGGGVDIVGGESALLDFYYQYDGLTPPVPSPFSFTGPQSGNPYFACVNTYEAVIRVPDLYTVNHVYFNPNPNGGIGPEIAGSGPVPPAVSTFFTAHVSYPGPGMTTRGDNIYTFTGLDYHGRITLDVTLETSLCPLNEGADDYFRAEIKAICNGCTDCKYTITCMTNLLFHHCPGYCANPGAGPPQDTRDFSLRRNTFGWVPDPLAPLSVPVVAATPGVALNRVYPCDEIIAESTGSVTPGGFIDLAFVMEYVSPADFTPPMTTMPVPFQFFEFVSGTLNYTIGSLTVTYPFTSSDISSSFTGTPTGNWPASGGSDRKCQLWVKIIDPIVLAAINSSGASVPLRVNLKMKVKPMDNVAPGFYPLPRVIGQFYSDKGEPCDPWGDNLVVLNVQTVRSFQILPANHANESYGWPFPTGVCERRFLLQTTVVGGLPSLDDFPFEDRPVLAWPGANDLFMTLPPGVQFGSADFTAVGRGLSQRKVNTSILGAQVTFNSYQNAMGVPQRWPLYDKDGLPIDLYIRGVFKNDCPATSTPLHLIGLTALNFPYTNQVFATDPGCRKVYDPLPSHSLTYPLAPSLDITLSSAVTPYVVTANPATVSGIKFTYLGWPRSAIENAWVRITSPCLDATKVDLNKSVSGISPETGTRYFKLGTIGPGPGQAAHIAFSADLTDCQPGVPCPVTIEYGYCCAGYPDKYPPDGSTDPLDPCVWKTYTFDVLPERSGMTMLVTPPPASSSACGPYVYNVRLTSTRLEEVLNPNLDITVPSGMTPTMATYLTSLGPPSGSLPIPSPPIPTMSGSKYIWPIDIWPIAIPAHKLPRGPFYVDLTFTFSGSCNAGTVRFHPSGQNLCGEPLPNAPDILPDFQHTIALADATPPNPPPPGAGDAMLECSNGAGIAMALAFVPSFTDDCTMPPIPTLVSDVTTPDPACPNAYVRLRTWTARDKCGNTSAAYTQTILVVDTTPPVISSCPPRTLNGVLVNGHCQGIIPDYTALIAATDNCGPVTITQSPVGNLVGPGTHGLTFTATDACGNQSTCVAPLTVVCSGATTLTCPESIIICIDSGGCGPMPDLTSYVAASFPCSPITVSQSVAPNTILCASGGPSSVVITVSDPCGTIASFTALLVFDLCCVEPPANMVLWLTFDEAFGNVAHNSRGGNNGALHNGGPVASPGTGPVHDSGGYVNRSLSFDGVDDSVRVPSYSSINVDTSDFSVDAWVRRGSGNVNGVIVQKMDYSTFVGWSLLVINNQLMLDIATAPSMGTTIPSGALLTPQTWHHVAISVCRNQPDGGRFYLDGRLFLIFDPTLLAASLSTTVPLAVGGPSVPGGFGGYFRGNIDEVELFCRCLAPNEIRDLWHARDKGKCKIDCTLEWAATFCFLDTTEQVQACINNPSPIPQICNYTLSWLPADGVHCHASGIGSTGFSPASGTVTVPAGGTLCWPITITKPVGLDPGECACYQIVIQPLNSTDRFVCQGSVCVVPDPNLCLVVEGGGINLNGGFDWSTNTINSVTWFITNAGPTAFSGQYAVKAYGWDMQPDASIILDLTLGPIEAGPGTLTHLQTQFYYSDCDVYRFRQLTFEINGFTYGSVVVGPGILREIETEPGAKCGPLNIEWNSGNVVVAWSGDCQLQTTAELTDPIHWTPVAGATSPYTLAPGAGHGFFRTLSGQMCSPNVVGYVNVSLGTGRTLIANPLNGANNLLSTILALPASADGTTILRYRPDMQSYGPPIQFLAGTGWVTTDPDPNWLLLNPGESVFIETPAPLNICFVGDVPQGNLINPLRAGISPLSSIAPLAAPLGGGLGFPAGEGDSVLIWSPGLQAFKEAYVYSEGSGWFSTNPDDPGPGGPVIGLGTGFMFQSGGPFRQWTENFISGACSSQPLPLTIIAQPRSQRVIEGLGVAFTVVAASGTPPLRYQWRHHGTPIIGATSSALAIEQAQPGDAGLYSVSITDSAGHNLISDSASLILVGPPLQFRFANGELTLIWSDADSKLQESVPPVAGWTDVSGATSPYLLTPVGSVRFYRTERR